MKRLIVWVIVVGALVAGGVFAYRWYESDRRAGGWGGGGTAAERYRTQPVRRTDVVSTISATGTLVPEEVIDVGAQVNGQIAEFGADENGRQVDYRSRVREGMVLARIDEALFAADVAASRAQVDQAEAQVRLATANRSQTSARLEQARRDWERAQRLGNSAALSRADYDAAQSAFEQAQAALQVNEAQIVQARAQVSQAQASLLRAQRNLNYCVIKSPVDGVIIDRRVEIGQTVVASLNAPSLFLIARDLRRMQVLVQVNEADIGSVKEGQTVEFRVDAFPGDVFRGTVRKVRLNATMSQNVVTYTVEITTENPDLKLLPYLTANVRFVVARRDDVLAAPNAALRWVPPAAGTGAAAGGAARQAGGQGSRGAGERAGGAANGGSGTNGGGGAEGSRKDAARADRGARGTVYVVRDGQPVGVEVATGLSDGAVTEVSGGGIAEGDEVIVGEVVAAAAAPSGTTNPFQPSFGGRRPGGGGGGSGGGGSGGGGAGGGGGGGGGGRPR